MSLELYDYCLKERIADANLIAKWKKQGYENLCCLRCIQTRDTNFGTNCICRVPKGKLEEVGSLLQLNVTHHRFSDSLFCKGFLESVTPKSVIVCDIAGCPKSDTTFNKLWILICITDHMKLDCFNRNMDFPGILTTDIGMADA